MPEDNAGEPTDAELAAALDEAEARAGQSAQLSPDEQQAQEFADSEYLANEEAAAQAAYLQSQEASAGSEPTDAELAAALDAAEAQTSAQPQELGTDDASRAAEPDAMDVDEPGWNASSGDAMEVDYPEPAASQQQETHADRQLDERSRDDGRGR
jgi:hypothetical protein